MKQIGVLVVEPARLFRDGLRQILHDPPFEVAAAAGTAVEAFEAAGASLPEVVIWGPGASDVEAEMVWARRRCPKPGLVRLVLLTDAAETTRLRRVVTSGVDAILSQDISGEVLQRSLALVMLGQQLFPAALAHSWAESASVPRADLIPFRVLDGGRAPVAEAERRHDVVLSEREGQIPRCLVDGASNKAIARELQITETTVKAHVKGLLRKLRASNRTQAAIWAVNNNIRVSEAVGRVTPLPSAGVSGRRASG